METLRVSGALFGILLDDLIDFLRHLIAYAFERGGDVGRIGLHQIRV